MSSWSSHELNAKMKSSWLMVPLLMLLVISCSVLPSMSLLSLRWLKKAPMTCELNSSLK